MVEEQLKSDNLILPNSLIVLIWSIFFSLSVLIYFGSAVFEIGFQTNASRLFNSSYQTAGVLLFCIIDTIVYINIGVILNGKLVRNRYSNAINYIKSKLFITDTLVLIILLVRFVMSCARNPQYDLTLSILDLFVALKFLNISRYNQILKLYYF